ncbi:MAG: hypothetical protein WKF87_06700 [Chryseolinea sp.]
MRQMGKTWRTSGGDETLKKYLPASEIRFEEIGQAIAGEALAIEKSLQESKLLLKESIKEALAVNKHQGHRTRFTFHTFDRGFRIEYDVKTELIRVYQATKEIDPSFKDYRLVVMDFSKAELPGEPQRSFHYPAKEEDQLHLTQLEFKQAEPAGFKLIEEDFLPDEKVTEEINEPKNQ